MKLVTGTASASNKEDGGSRVVGSSRLMLDEDEDGNTHGVNVGHFPLFTPII